MYFIKTVRLSKKKIILGGIILAVAVVFGGYVRGSWAKMAHLSTEIPEKTVIIDAGHGGMDGGAVGVHGEIEKELNLNIATYLKARLEAEGFSVKMVRESDLSLHDSSADTIASQKISDLHNRVALFNENADALVVSIHQNTFTESKYHGAQMFYGVKNPESPIVAQYIQDAIVRQLQPENKRKIKKGPTSVYLLMNAEPAMVLVECGFLSNPEEATKLSSDDYQQQMAEAISMGIIDYMDSIDGRNSQQQTGSYD